MDRELTLWLAAAVAAVTVPVALVIPRRHLLFLFLALLVVSNVRVSVAGNNIKPYQFLLPLVALRYLPTIVRNAWMRRAWADYLMFLLAGALLYSFTYTVDTSRSAHDLVLLLSLIALYYLVRFCWEGQDQLWALVGAFLAGAVLVVLYGYAELALTLAGVNLPVYVRGRLQSTFTEPDWLGNYICFILPIAAMCYLLRIRTWLAPHLLLLLNVSLVAQLLLSYTRGAWLALSAAALIFCALERKYLLRVLQVFALFTLLLALLVTVEKYLPGDVLLSERLAEIANTSTGTGLYRKQVYLETLLLCYQREGILWRGYGPGTFGLVYSNSDPTHPLFNASGPENAYLSLLFAYGAATTVLFLVVVAWPMALLVLRGRKLRALGEERRSLALAFFLSLFAQLVSINVSNSVSFPFIWVSLAMIVNCVTFGKEEAAARGSPESAADVPNAVSQRTGEGEGARGAAE